MNKFARFIITVILITVTIGALIVFIIEDFNSPPTKYMYKCTDYKGDTIYCTYAYSSKGGMFGYLEDGTLITITSYKRILMEE